MAERLFRLLSLFFLGVGLTLGLASFEKNGVSEDLQAVASRNPSLEIEAAQEIQRINNGEMDAQPISRHDRHRPLKEMAASLPQ
jgi:hypothetical protein